MGLLSRTIKYRRWNAVELTKKIHFFLSSMIRWNEFILQQIGLLFKFLPADNYRSYESQKHWIVFSFLFLLWFSLLCDFPFRMYSPCRVILLDENKWHIMLTIFCKTYSNESHQFESTTSVCVAYIAHVQSLSWVKTLCCFHSKRNNHVKAYIFYIYRVCFIV